jgi:hypothetical protein
MANDFKQPFLRKAELRILGRSIQIAANNQRSLSSVIDGRWTIKGDGTRNTQQIAFNIKKTLVGTPNESTITISNLSPATRTALMNSDLQVELYVGWSNVPMSLLAQGRVLQVIPSKEGTDNKTVLNLFDGLNAISASVLAKTFPVTTAVKDIVFELASAMVDVKIDKAMIDVDGAVGERGYVVNGRVAVELDKLANSYGFTWSVQDGVFRAIKDTRAGKNQHNISAAEGYLFKVNPTFADKQQILQAMEITALMQPRVVPGDLVNLKSAFYPQFSGQYKVHTIEFNGDTAGANWEMKIESKKFGV